MHYYRARWYDGNLGRFISEDPIGDFHGGDVNSVRVRRQRAADQYRSFRIDRSERLSRSELYGGGTNRSNLTPSQFRGLVG
ncbi:MAG: hypothetical protein IPJ30_23815 [Acidobacteria bacterium]|nr:hypothetical protein [Acidobacteriota bacterium]